MKAAASVMKKTARQGETFPVLIMKNPHSAQNPAHAAAKTRSCGGATGTVTSNAASTAAANMADCAGVFACCPFGASMIFIVYQLEMRAAYLSYGFCAVIFQLALLRELAALMTGHELMIGLCLSSWLAWSAAGCAVRVPASAAAVFAVSGAASVALCRIAGGFIDPGIIPGIFRQAFFAVVLCAPAALASGMAARALLGKPREFYCWEAAGAFIAGIIYSAFLAPVLRIEIICAAAGTVFFAVCARKNPIAIAAVAATAALGAWLAGQTVALRYGGFAVAEIVQTPYSRIALAGNYSAGTLFENGLVSAAWPAPEYYEPPVHIPLLAVRQPRKILLLGAGAPLAAREAQKHGPPEIDIVSADAAWLETARALAPKEKNISFIAADPRACLRGGARYDAIINLSGEPASAALNRLYTAEFFRAASAALTPGGILAFELASSETYISPAEAGLNGSVISAAGEAFPEIKLVPGAKMLVLASREKINLSPERLSAAWKARKIQSSFARPETFPFLLSPERMKWLAKTLPAAPPNTDEKPAAYLHSLKLFSDKSSAPAALACCALLAACAFFARGKIIAAAKYLKEPAHAAVFAAGFAGMAVETALLLRYQPVYGALYRQLGLLFSAFMLGLAAGGRLGGRFEGRAWLPCLCCAACAAGAAFYPNQWLPQGLAGGTAVFCALLFAAGASGGAVYSALASGGAKVYAADLWGACAGAVMPALAAPALSVKAALLIAALAAACGAAAARSARHE